MESEPCVTLRNFRMILLIKGKFSGFGYIFMNQCVFANILLSYQLFLTNVPSLTNTKLITSPRHCNCPAFSINLITITFPRKTVKKRNYSHTNSFKLIKWRLCNRPRIHIFDIHLIHHCFNRNEYMLLHF